MSFRHVMQLLHFVWDTVVGLLKYIELFVNGLTALLSKEFKPQFSTS